MILACAKTHTTEVMGIASVLKHVVPLSTRGAVESTAVLLRRSTLTLHTAHNDERPRQSGGGPCTDISDFFHMPQSCTYPPVYFRQFWTSWIMVMCHIPSRAFWSNPLSRSQVVCASFMKLTSVGCFAMLCSHRWKPSQAFVVPHQVTTSTSTTAAAAAAAAAATATRPPLLGPQRCLKRPRSAERPRPTAVLSASAGEAAAEEGEWEV